MTFSHCFKSLPLKLLTSGGATEMIKTSKRWHVRPNLLMVLMLIISTLVWLGAEVYLRSINTARLEAHQAQFDCWRRDRGLCPIDTRATEDAVACHQVYDSCQAQGFDAAVSAADASYMRWQRRAVWTRIEMLTLSLIVAVSWVYRALRRRYGIPL